MNSVHSSADTKRRAIVVSPRQAAVGTSLGGPIACMHFIRMNYLASGASFSASRVLKVGVLLLLAWNIVIALDVLVPKPGSIAFDFILKVTPFILVIVARHYVQKHSESLPRQYDFCSNWNVVGRALLCLLASIACILPAVAFVVAVTLLTAQ